MNNSLRIALILSIIQLSIIHLTGQPLNQKEVFTHADTLRGTYGPARDWWDVTKYDLHVSFNINDSTISGYNIIQFKTLKKGNVMQIDLQEPMILDGYQFGLNRPASSEQKLQDFKKDGNAYFINVSKNYIRGDVRDKIYLTLFYHGRPRVAVRPPWDGGAIWKKDKNKNPWVTIACQGLGASVWYPCKDHQHDEPDSAEMHITCPDSLMCVGNGRYRGKISNNDGTATYDWAVVNPINNYCIIPYIGKYVHFGEVFKGEKGDLDMDYWVLDYNLEKAKTQFKDAPRMMKAFEFWFGPYPFYEDGYKLVDAPHLGMEHQGATAYGNGYKMGYAGRDLSGTGWGMKWDFIIVHESGHDWFANNITSKDIADMWIHEGFTNYSETLFTEFYYGKEAGSDYVIGTRKLISNTSPIIGEYGVNKEGSGDMYYKGGNMLHTIRQLINNDSLFRNILRGLNKTFYHQTVDTKQVEDYMSKESHMDLSKIFDQYLRGTMIPTLEYKIENNQLSYKWTNCVKGFEMPVKVLVAKDKYQLIYPTDSKIKSTEVNLGDEKFQVERNFYVKLKM
ncbi:MAG: M1 family metallopeptidase [Ferruginibacter sp.]